MQLSLGCNLKSWELAFGKVASDSRIFWFREKYIQLMKGMGTGGGREAQLPWYLLESLPLFSCMWHHCHVLTLIGVTVP